MNNINVIVIPAPDKNGFSDKPYVKSIKSESFCSFVHSQIGDSCFDVVNLLYDENDMRLDAYVDDEGKLKGLEANNVFYDFSISCLGYEPLYTLDGCVILSMTNAWGETVDFKESALKLLLDAALESHARVQGKPIQADEPEIRFYSF